MIKSDRWTFKKKEFLHKLEKYLQTNHFPPPISRDYLIKLEKSKEENEKVISDLIEEKNKLTEFNIALQKAKDKKEVIAIKKKYAGGEKEIFEEKLQEIKKYIAPYDRVLMPFIYSDFTGNSLTVDDYTYNSDIEQLVAKGYLDSDWAVNWDKKELKNLYSCLKDLQDFIEKQCSVELIEDLEEEYKTDFSFSQLDCWETVIGTNISRLLK